MARSDVSRHFFILKFHLSSSLNVLFEGSGDGRLPWQGECSFGSRSRANIIIATVHVTGSHAWRTRRAPEDLVWHRVRVPRRSGLQRVIGSSSPAA